MSHTTSQHADLPPSTAGPPLDNPEEDSPIDINAVIYSFLDAFPTPTDDQVHHLASLLGLDVKTFEEQIFKMLQTKVQETFNDLPEDLDDAEDEGMIDDPVDLFLITYFLLNPEPTEEQIHSLAQMIDMTSDALEERIFSLLADLNASESEGEDETETDDLDIAELLDEVDDDDLETELSHT